eukprot:TRINITY_DN6342_c0_g1_i1.p1 TRINITY_DN6342_c0_g1~~TRINITY_DN6342_c0_g1_i1.p1  ORF type:complete len:317 (+),score=67.14 TRINITY_DN6342_c0_g1_i1:73-1023(+)
MAAAAPDAAASAAAASRLFIGEYSPELYQALSDDEVRVEAYRKALAARVKGLRVLDVGTGPVALLAVLAARAGAAHVTAVEVSEAVATAARRHVEAEGLSGVIDVIVGYSTQLALPEVDVVIHELVGSMASEEGIAFVLDDLSRRRPAVVDSTRPGWVIPRKTATWVAPISLHLPAASSGSAAGRGRKRRRGAEEATPRLHEVRLPVGFPMPHQVLLGDPREAEAVDAEALLLEESRELRWTVATSATWTGFVCAPKIEFDEDTAVDAWRAKTHWRHVAVMLPEAQPLRSRLPLKNRRKDLFTPLVVPITASGLQG